MDRLDDAVSFDYVSGYERGHFMQISCLVPIPSDTHTFPLNVIHRSKVFLPAKISILSHTPPTIYRPEPDTRFPGARVDIGVWVIVVFANASPLCHSRFVDSRSWSSTNPRFRVQDDSLQTVSLSIPSSRSLKCVEASEYSPINDEAQ